MVILAVILTTISQTVSFINSDHQFYESRQERCMKCHGDIKIQQSASLAHSSFSCTNCHPGSKTDHIEKKPECGYCHETPQLNDEFEAHTGFAAMRSKGCVSCHTDYNVIINYSRPEYIEYDIINESGNWVISNFATIGKLNLSYDAMREGENHNLKNVSCKDCHEDIFNAVSAGGHAVVIYKNGTQVKYHSTNGFSGLEAWCRSCHNRSYNVSGTQQHSARRTNCEDCHKTYNLTHPGNLYITIDKVPHLYRSLVCIACKSVGWRVPNGTLKFKVRQEPYFDVATW